jgi:predicted transcriptional regulator
MGRSGRSSSGGKAVATFRSIHYRPALLRKRPSAACRCGFGLLNSPAQAIAAEASMSKTLSIEMEDEVRRALDRLVRQTARSVDDIVNQAVRDYLDVHEWQQRKIEAGIAAADRGEFATEDELARIAAKYSKRG